MGFSLFGFGKKKDAAQDAAPVAAVMPTEPEAPAMDAPVSSDASASADAGV